jgi:Holliday junction DNA helicase RuvB
MDVNPQTFEEFIGQDSEIDKLQMYVDAAVARGELLGHTLIEGPPGLGKTVAARCAAIKMGVPIVETSGQELTRKVQLNALLMGLATGTIIFIDEIHSLRGALCELLQLAMDTLKINLISGQGINPFIVFGATTNPDELPKPFRSRFRINICFDYYSDDVLVQIVRRTAKIKGVPIDEDAAGEIARRSRGIPREANILLDRVRDFAEQRAGRHITLAVARDALQMVGVDTRGLNTRERKLMNILINSPKRRPVSLGTLAAVMGTNEGTVAEIEQYPKRIGFLEIINGRIATDDAYRHFGKEPPKRW